MGRCLRCKVPILWRWTKCRLDLLNIPYWSEMSSIEVQEDVLRNALSVTKRGKIKASVMSHAKLESDVESECLRAANVIQ